jgi:hypothetical protein
MKFLIDMNLSPLWIPFLAEKGLYSGPLVNSRSTVGG